MALLPAGLCGSRCVDPILIACEVLPLFASEELVLMAGVRLILAAYESLVQTAGVGLLLPALVGDPWMEVVWRYSLEAPQHVGVHYPHPGESCCV